MKELQKFLMMSYKNPTEALRISSSTIKLNRSNANKQRSSNACSCAFVNFPFPTTQINHIGIAITETVVTCFH